MKKAGLFILFVLILLIALFMFRSSPEVRDELLSAEKLMSASPDSSLQILQSMDAKHLHGEDNALYALLLTQAKFKNHIPVKSDSLINIAVEYYKVGKDSLRKAQSYFYKGRIEANTNNLQKALIFYQRASEAAISTDNYELLKLVYNYWGLLLRKQSLYDDALIKLEKSLDYTKLNNDTTGCIFVLKDIGAVYLLVGNLELASLNYERALSLAKLIKNEKLISDLYNNLSVLYMERGKYDSAMSYVDKSILLTSDSIALLSRLSLKGEIFFQEQKYDSARYYFEKGEKYNDILSRAAFCRIMSKLEEKFGNYKEALAYRNQFVLLKDSIENKERENDLAELQKKYDYSLIENENNRLELEKMTRNVIILCIVVVLIAVIWIYSYRYKKVRREKDELVKAGKEQLSQVMKKLSEQVDEMDEYQQKTKTELGELKRKVLKSNEAIKKIDLLNNMDTNQRIKNKEEMALTPKELENLLEVVNACYDGFARRLVERFSKLTDENLYFCCLLRMKAPLEIASILLNVSEDTLTKRKYRLKKGQIDLPVEYSSLDDFLSEF